MLINAMREDSLSKLLLLFQCQCCRAKLLSLRSDGCQALEVWTFTWWTIIIYFRFAQCEVQSNSASNSLDILNIMVEQIRWAEWPNSVPISYLKLNRVLKMYLEETHNHILRSFIKIKHIFSPFPILLKDQDLIPFLCTDAA